jgi:hypothetical protein
MSRTRSTADARREEALTAAIREVGGVFGVAVLASVFAANGSYLSPQAFSDGVAAAVLVPGRAALRGERAPAAMPEAAAA